MRCEIPCVVKPSFKLKTLPKVKEFLDKEMIILYEKHKE